MISHRKPVRTQFLNSLRKAFNIALQSQKKDKVPVDELIDMCNYNATERRRFISNVLKTGIAVSAAGALKACKKISDVVPPSSPDSDILLRKINQPEIVIVGGGMAGLNCAYQLQKAGYTSKIYEGSSRIGGRIFTKNDILAPGLYTELGGEFIDSGHRDMLQLCNEFSLGLLDLGSHKEKQFVRDSFYINGKFHSETQVIKAFQPYAAQIAADINSLPDMMEYDNFDAVTLHFDQMSIAAYLDSIGMHGFLREGIETAYLTEYGLETNEQSSINFLFLFSADTSKGFDIFGASDERYKIEGGNTSLTSALYNKVKDNVVTEHKLVRISEAPNGYALYFNNASGNTVKVNANMVVSAIPFTLLREVELEITLPSWKLNAIKNLGYGTNSKLLLGFNKRIWRNYQHSGYSFTDKKIETGWDNSWAQPGHYGGYTVFQGGIKGLELGGGSPESQAPEFVNQLEQMWPGCRNAFNGNVKRMHWPAYPFTKGSYSCYKVGQYTSIRGAEIKHIKNLYFAGEHCSANFQGYMNGAAQTGRVAAQKILKAISAGTSIISG